MVLGGLVRIDLLECESHLSSPEANHIRITPFTNLPIHITSHEKAAAIFDEDPASFWSRKSSIETVTTRALGKDMLTALELEVKSTGNSERNTTEIVIAGLGFIAIGGNFGRAKLSVWTPEGRGVGIRQPVVQRIGSGFSLRIVKRKKVIRMIKLGKKGQVKVAKLINLGMEQTTKKKERNEEETESANETENVDLGQEGTGVGSDVQTEPQSQASVVGLFVR
jgi:hypothetical protein